MYRMAKRRIVPSTVAYYLAKGKTQREAYHLAGGADSDSLACTYANREDVKRWVQYYTQPEAERLQAAVQAAITYAHETVAGADPTATHLDRKGAGQLAAQLHRTAVGAHVSVDVTHRIEFRGILAPGVTQDAIEARALASQGVLDVTLPVALPPGDSHLSTPTLVVQTLHEVPGPKSLVVEGGDTPLPGGTPGG
jgi:hypothetical protein